MLARDKYVALVQIVVSDAQVMHPLQRLKHTRRQRLVRRRVHSPMAGPVKHNNNRVSVVLTHSALRGSMLRLTSQTSNNQHPEMTASWTAQRRCWHGKRSAAC